MTITAYSMYWIPALLQTADYARATSMGLARSMTFQTAWMRDLPVIPACFAGLRAQNLPMPLSARQGLQLNDAQGLRRLYCRIAQALGFQPPARDYDALCR